MRSSESLFRRRRSLLSALTFINAARHKLVHHSSWMSIDEFPFKEHFMFSHILVPTDGSELAEQAARRAISFAKASNAKITFFFARPNTAASLYGETSLLRSIDPSLLEKAVHQRANEILAKAEALAKAAGVECESVSTASNGEPYEGIIAAATDKGCDLILMASHGYRGVKSLLIGSQTQKVLTHSSLPVLVYR